MSEMESLLSSKLLHKIPGDESKVTVLDDEEVVVTADQTSFLINTVRQLFKQIYSLVIRKLAWRSP